MADPVIVTATNLTRQQSAIDRSRRPRPGTTVWITGLSGSGKSSLAQVLEQQAVERGWHAYVLDGDNLRLGLNSDLGFAPADRVENVRRVGHVAQMFADSGALSIVSLISPHRRARKQVRDAHDAADLPFVEVFLDTPVSVCEQRDAKGLYAKSRAGEIKSFTGIDSSYEAPENAEMVLRPSDGDASTMADRVMSYVLTHSESEALRT